MKLLLVPICTLALLCASVQASRLSEHIASPELKAKMQEVYGARAIQRAEAFSRLLAPRAGTTDQQKLELVNNYFNNLTYSEDPRLWGDEDYWANPLEFISGRCASNFFAVHGMTDTTTISSGLRPIFSA